MSNGKRYAVIVGVSKYHDDQIADLPCAKNDALRLAQSLINAGSFNKDQVYLLANDVPDVPTDFKCYDPTRGNVLQKLQYVADAAGADDLIVVFFAGHGVEVSKNPYLLSCDTMMDVLSHTGVKVADVNDILGKSKAKTVLRIFDACRSSFGDTRGVLGRMTKGFEDALMHTGTGWASFSSCSSGEVAHESGDLNHGIFSYYLCEGLEGKAANDEGTVTFDRLVDYVRTSVGIWCDQQSQKQTPHLQTDLSGIVVLSVGNKAFQIETPVPDSPFDALQVAIDRHLSQTPRDARNLTYTDAQELEGVAKTAQTAIRTLAESFRHPALALGLSERKPLEQLDGTAWQVLHQDMDAVKLRQEFSNNTSAIMIEFNSSEVVIPRTKVAIAMVRFSFFYWIWYYHVYVKDQQQHSFKPSPPTTKGYFTFKPRAASDGQKLDMTIRELFKRCSNDLLSWSNQLKEFVDNRLDPLRKVGTIIE